MLQHGVVQQLVATCARVRNKYHCVALCALLQGRLPGYSKFAEAWLHCCARNTYRRSAAHDAGMHSTAAAASGNGAPLVVSHCMPLMFPSNGWQRWL